MLSGIRFGRVIEDTEGYFGIGQFFIPAGTIVIVVSHDLKYSEYGCFANLPDLTFIHIPDIYLEVQNVLHESRP